MLNPEHIDRVHPKVKEGFDEFFHPEPIDWVHFNEVMNSPEIQDYLEMRDTLQYLGLAGFGITLATGVGVSQLIQRFIG